MTNRPSIRRKQELLDEFRELNPHRTPLLWIMSSIVALNVGFGALMLLNDYLFGSIVHLQLQLLHPLAPLWWFYVYLPIAVFFCGIAETMHYHRLFVAKRSVHDASILLFPTLAHNCERSTHLGIALLLCGFISFCLAKDRYVSHLFILIFWLAYMHINTYLCRKE